MALPNFIVFGSLKAGTTSLYYYFKGHPEIFMSPLKEPRYFSFDHNDPFLVNKPASLFPVKTFDHYQSLFSAVGDEKAIGEVSPGYLESPIAAARIKASIPQARLIASLRSPVERAYSMYLMAVRSGSEKRSVYEAFRQSDQSVCWAPYYENIKRYFDVFDSERIKIILFDDLKKNGQSVVKELFQFLEVDDSYIPDFSVKHNVGGLPKSRVLSRVLKFNNKRLRIALAPYLPNSLLDLRQRLQRDNMQAAPPLPDDVRQRLSAYFADDIFRLQDFLQRDLSVWLDE